MLSHCANLQCRKPFLRLREGKLFLVETDRSAKPDKTRAPSSHRPRQQTRLVEHYWLCDECSSFLTLSFERGQGMITIPLPGAAGKKTVRALGFDEIDETRREELILAGRGGC